VGFIVIRAIVIIVPFLTLFTLNKISFLALILNPVVCFSVADDITQVSFIPTLVALLRWSDAASRVPVWNQVVVKVLTPPSVSLLGGGVLNDSRIQHGLEALDLRADLLIVLRQLGCQLVNDHL
jgi:hypothetical protein